MSRWRQVVFALVCLVQVAVPASLIVKHEQTRSQGTLWKFQTAPVDPGDPFRGRYVQLGFAADRVPVPLADPKDWLRHEQRAYAELATGPDGYARLVRLRGRRPSGVDYVDVFVLHSPEQPAEAPPSMIVRVPFDRYYLPEARAPQVEREYAEASRKAQANTWAEVRVRDGHAVLVNLVLDGKPVL
ncbi:MAG: GDYXXLXY domain-containing protein [Nevskiaceae bacterium]